MGLTGLPYARLSLALLHKMCHDLAELTATEPVWHLPHGKGCGYAWCSCNGKLPIFESNQLHAQESWPVTLPALPKHCSFAWSL